MCSVLHLNMTYENDVSYPFDEGTKTDSNFKRTTGFPNNQRKYLSGPTAYFYRVKTQSLGL